MRKTRIAVAIAATHVVSAAAAAAPADRPVRLYVTAAMPEDRLDIEGLTGDELRTRRDRARAVRRFREKQMKKELGKKRETWVPAAEDELRQLEEAEALAEAAYEYRKADGRGLAECVSEIAGFFQDKGVSRTADRVMLASSASEADLVVEVAASRTAKTLPTQERPDRCYLLFTLGPGGRMDPARLTRVPGDYRLKRAGLRVWRLAAPRGENPLFYFESYNGGGKEFGCEGAAADAASAAVDKFIKDNYRILMDN